eukprot:6185414-Pleurochrysis_carterae.AAC.2
MSARGSVRTRLTDADGCEVKIRAGVEWRHVRAGELAESVCMWKRRGADAAVEQRAGRENRNKSVCRRQMRALMR